jgi:hypothetical protein
MKRAFWNAIILELAILFHMHVEGFCHQREHLCSMISSSYFIVLEVPEPKLCSRLGVMVSLQCSEQPTQNLHLLQQLGFMLLMP